MNTLIARCLLPCLLLLGLLAGCSKPKKTIAHGSKSSPDCLQVSFLTEVRSLDPRLGIDFPSIYALKMLYEGLMYIGPDGKIYPAIAESYTVSNDHTTYTFKLRPAFWSNGDRVTAYDFEYTWKRVVDPEFDSIGVHNFYPIRNARAIALGELPIDEIGVKALDNDTLVVDLEHPTSYFLEMVATASFYPVNSRVDIKNPKWATQEGREFVCNGPYTLEKHRYEDEIIVIKNPTYWNAKEVRMPKIRIAIVKDPTTQLNMFEKGQLQWLGKPLSKIPLDAMHHLKKLGKIRFAKTLGVYWYFINTEAFPFNNEKIRRALSYAVNREAITNYILQGKEIPARSVLPPSLSSGGRSYIPRDNIAQANRLFQEALYEMNIPRDELPTITINYNAAPVHMRVAEAIQESWSQVFGLTVKLEQLDWKAHYAKLQKGNFQIGGMGWQSWLRDPMYIMQTFRDLTEGVNMSHWQNIRYKKLIAKAEVEIDPIKRQKLFMEAETILMREMPVIPIYFTTMAYAQSDLLKGVYISELYDVDFRWSYFENE